MTATNPPSGLPMPEEIESIRSDLERWGIHGAVFHGQRLLAAYDALAADKTAQAAEIGRLTAELAALKAPVGDVEELAEVLHDAIKLHGVTPVDQPYSELWKAAKTRVTICLAHQIILRHLTHHERPI